MKRNNIQKTSRALVASALAVGSVAVVSPSLPEVKAAVAFKDLPSSSGYYDSVQKLIARNVLRGYPDGTFRPNAPVTRGQAAKMIALSLNMNTSSVVNPQFKDVSTSNPYYRYIAALVQAGIINGFADNKFHPNEKLTRGQIAKILVRGFKFESATEVGDMFVDVNGRTGNALEIQTLYNLKITSGVTPVKYSPNGPVTRGQLAALIINSEKVKKDTADTYKITGISGSTVYINSIPYRLDSSLQEVFNDENRQVLKGAIIEGVIRNSKVLSISSLTLTASGTKNSPLIFEGNYETLSANISVKGNYIRFQNFDLTGTVTVTDTVRKSLTNYTSRLPQNSLASLGGALGFINWTTTTTYLATVDKQIEFDNTTVYKLVIGQDRTKILSDTDLELVSIVANVKEIEIQSDIKKLVMNTDTPLTLYGKGDITRAEYDSITDLNLYMDSTVSTLVVDNTFGWVDLGVDTDVTNVILPKGSTPNQTFGDYLVDIDNIWNIKDSSGNYVDKNPVENQTPIDKTAPIISGLTATSGSGGQATVTFNVNERGNYYYIIKKAKEDAPSLKSIVKGPPVVVGRTGTMYSGSNTFTATGLEEKSEYVIYLVGVDGNNNVSTIEEAEFTMKDSVPPTINYLALDPLHGGQRLKFDITASEPGKYYYYYREGSGSQDTAITAQYIKTNAKGSGNIAAVGKTEQIITGLTALTSYELYVVVEDSSGNFSTVSYDKETTSALDNVAPFIPATKQVLEKTGLNEFTVYFSEALDYVEANKEENYILSGTGIQNITGQKTIPPSHVEYVKGDTKAVITVPSTTGLVNNDTIRVTIQPGLVDLAGNAFESTVTQQTPRNYAIYKHGDAVKPLLALKKFEANTEYTHGLLNVNASEAGTYYYVILPSVNNKDNLSMRDIMDRKLEALLPSANNNQTTKQLVPSKYYGAFSPIEMGDSTLDIPIPNDLSVFYTWNIYMFMTDRSGNLTTAVSTIEMVNDRVAPAISNQKVSMQTGDKTARLEFNADEAGGVRYILKEKYQADGVTLNEPATPNQVKGSSSTLQMVQGPNNPEFNVPTAHKDYVLYYAMYDTAGNYTGLQTTEFYSDGTKPEVDDVINRKGKTFEITFSENIMREANEISTLNGTNWADLMTMTGANLSDYKFVSYTPGASSTNESHLVIEDIDGINVDTTFTIKMNNVAYDSIKANNQFDLNDFGKYLYRSLGAAFVEIALVPDTSDQYVDATFDLLTAAGQEYESEETLNYYYLSASLTTNESVIQAYTSQQVINTVLTGTDSSLAKGRGTISTRDSRATVQLSHPTKFYNGDWIVVVLEDKYGNLSKVYQKVGYKYTP